MIEITEVEESVYKCIKRGSNNSNALRLNLNKSAQAIRNIVFRLQAQGLVEVAKVGRNLSYKAVRKKYKVKQNIVSVKTTGECVPRGTFDLSSYNISLNYEQMTAIEVYKKEKTYKGVPMQRTEFAKSIKAPKLHVTFALGAMK